MMNSSPRRNRRFIRIQGYDYSRAGAYFVTICTQNRAHLFGEIVGNKMRLNAAGQMVHHWYFELENKFPDNEKGQTYMSAPTGIREPITQYGMAAWMV